MNSDREFKTEQEEFWAGEFGSEYIDRNQGNQLLASNLALFSTALKRAQKPDSCIEFGANIGMNLRALKLLYPDQDQYAIEINPDAIGELRKLIPPDHVFETSILDFKPLAMPQTWNLVLIKGVLIHINPEFLEQVYAKLYQATSRYLMVCEYYNPTPVSVNYRGYSDRLFKRDFCGEILDRYPTLQLIDYGFGYHRDPSFPQGDSTWFLMERR
ncbi:MAG: pseudaminic acid biosynthesis-associated methylase [Candidatus Competibacteraceae bacterium]|nr:pseudaminic acid biosynthesis-associated methylase [Candidatus Competibacteraceae bacterium]